MGIEPTTFHKCQPRGMRSELIPISRWPSACFTNGILTIIPLDQAWQLLEDAHARGEQGCQLTPKVMNSNSDQGMVKYIVAYKISSTRIKLNRTIMCSDQTPLLDNCPETRLSVAIMSILLSTVAANAAAEAYQHVS